MHITRYPLATELVDDDVIFIASENEGPRRYKIKDWKDKIDNLGTTTTGLQSSITNLSSSVSNNTSNISSIASRVSALEAAAGSSSDEGQTISQATSSSAGIMKLYNSHSSATDGTLTARYVSEQLTQLQQAMNRQIGITVNEGITTMGANVLGLMSINATDVSRAKAAGRVFLVLAGSLRWEDNYYPFNYTAVLGTNQIETSYTRTLFDTYLPTQGYRQRFHGFMTNGVVQFQLETLILDGQVNFHLGVDRGWHYWGGTTRFNGGVSSAVTEIRFDYNYCRMYV